MSVITWQINDTCMTGKQQLQQQVKFKLSWVKKQ